MRRWPPRTSVSGLNISGVDVGGHLKRIRLGGSGKEESERADNER
jgi:hypothetical protein